MKEILSVTIDGETYREWKHAVESIEAKKHPIVFEGYGFHRYEWRMYTNDEALNKMAERYKFMLYKHDEENARNVYALEQKIERLNATIEDLKKQIPPSNK